MSTPHQDPRLPSDQDATGRTFGDEELAALREVLDSGVLTSTKGHFVKDFESSFASHIGAKHAFACTSGTAAIHCALAAVDPDPGDEVITTSVTDMGALTPIIYQGAIPVFADIDPRTYNVTAETIEARLSDRTRAVIVTHLFGQPCEMQPIRDLLEPRGIPIIEDCAQAFLATDGGRQAGTLGTIGCFSLQQGKHITTGEGGVVVTDDDALARRLFLFINKAWGYGDAKPDHYFVALNYRMSELQGAVAWAQLAKLGGVVERRQTTAAVLSERLKDLPGVGLPTPVAGTTHAYWKYCVDVDPEVHADGPAGIAGVLREAGIASAPRYIQKPAFQCEVFRDRRTFGKSGYPFNLAREEALDWSPENFPGTFQALSRVLVLPWNEQYQEKHIDFVADHLRRAALAGSLVG